MKRKVLGRTGFEVPILGLGAANLGLPTQASAYEQHVDNPNHASLADPVVGVETVRVAIESGVRWIDTAPKYCYGESERIISRAMWQYPELRESAIVTTKIGLVHAGDGFDYSYGAAMRCFEDSCERLGIWSFPVVYLHDPMGFEMEFMMSGKGVVGAMEDLKRWGAIRFLGIAADDPETAADYIDTGVFDVATVSGAWSLVNQKAAERILPAARRHNVGIVVTTAIERGLLATGVPIPGVKYIQREFSPELIAHVAKIKALCNELGISLLAAALQWAVRDPQIAMTIPGARTPEEARMNICAASEEIPAEFWERLEPMIRHFNCRV